MVVFSDGASLKFLKYGVTGLPVLFSRFGFQAHRLNSGKDVLVSFVAQQAFPLAAVIGCAYIFTVMAEKQESKEKLDEFQKKGEYAGSSVLFAGNKRWAGNRRKVLLVVFTTAISIPVLLIMRNEVGRFVEIRLVCEPEFDGVPLLVGESFQVVCYCWSVLFFMKKRKMMSRFTRNWNSRENKVSQDQRIISDLRTILWITALCKRRW